VSTLADLKPDSRNARKHNPRNVGMIEASLQRDGFGRSILLAADGTVIAGNATIDAAASAGIEDVLIVESDGTKVIAVKRTDVEPGTDRFHMLALSDNRAAELAEWDADVLAGLQDEVDLDAFFADDELAKILGTGVQGGLTDPDDVPEVPEEPVTKPGDLWLLGRHRLLCGDSTVATDVDRLMAGAKADMVWTDPPYGVAVGDKNKWLDSTERSRPNRKTFNRVTKNLENDTLGESQLQQLLQDSFSLLATYCAPGASWYVAAPAGPLHLLFGQVLHDLGIWRQTLIWVKDNSTFSPLGVTYHWQAEPIFYGWLPGAKHQDYTDRKQTTVWNIDRPTKSPDHPTMKPVELVTRAMEHTSLPGQLVADMFLGSGTTMIAAEQLNRTCYGMEIDPHYCNVIVNRWQNFTGQEAELETSALKSAAD
jgi:DNA modification methylase